ATSHPKHGCSTSPRASSSDCADNLPKRFHANSSTLHRGSDCHHLRWPARVAAAGGGTAAGADADAAATVRQCWGDLLESIASEHIERRAIRRVNGSSSG